MSTTQKLEAARKRLAVLDAQWDRTGLPGGDPGALSGVKRTRTQHAKSIDRSTRIASEAVQLQEEIRALEHTVKREAEDAQIRAEAHCDIGALQPGDIIRYERHGSPSGLGRVVRVNAKTVTLEAPAGMDQPKVPYDRIVETRHKQEAT